MKRKINYPYPILIHAGNTPVKIAHITAPDELFVRDALVGKLYSNTERNRTVVKVIASDFYKDGGSTHFKIICWADLLGQWLSLVVPYTYVLSTNTAATLATLRRVPTGMDDDSIVKKELRKVRRSAIKIRKTEIARAKRAGKTPDPGTSLRQTKNIDPRTGIRTGTRKWQVAQILLSGNSAKIMLRDLHALVAKFIQEKPNAQYKIVGLKSYTDWLVRWTCRSGKVNSEVFAPALKALRLSEKYARSL